MGTIETKYSIGDSVFHAGTTIEQMQHDCPDCLGVRKWDVKSPAGGEFQVQCPRCASGYQSNRELSLNYSAHKGYVRSLTIGSVRFDSSDGGATYMCEETGVGSGQIYREEDLLQTFDEAQICADLKASKANAEIGWIVKQFEGTLKFSDYQLESAVMKAAKDLQIETRVKTQILFEDLRDCETMQEIEDRLVLGWGDDE